MNRFESDTAAGKAVGARVRGGLVAVALTLCALASAQAATPGRPGPPDPGHTGPGLRYAGETQGRSRAGHDRAAHEQRPAFGPEEAAQRARQRFGGRVLDVTLARSPDGPYYRIRILEHGRVRIVDIDARH